jgi:hypothetical protein
LQNKRHDDVSRAPWEEERQSREKGELVQYPMYSTAQTDNGVRSKTSEDGDYDLNNEDDVSKIVRAYLQVTPFHLKAIIMKTFPKSSQDSTVSA